MLAIGARFERYTIEALLGSGGMGEVYRAYDPRLERRVALKILREGDATPGARDSSGHAARLLREARAAAALDHPNVVAIFDVGEVDGTTFLAMELIEGRTLRSFVGADVPLATRLAWLVDVARALALAHRRGLVHRDIKPENVMVRDDGVIKVLDFGIARRARALATDATLPGGGARPADTAASTVAGTPHYMAPEQMLGEALDGRTDQFAWGVVAYELLAGGPMPWPGANDLVSLVAAVLGRDPAPLPTSPELPAHVPGVVMRALRRAPDERFASMDDLVTALGGTLERAARVSLPPTGAVAQTHASNAFAETLAGGPPPASLLPARPAPRRRRLLVGLAALAVIATAAIATVVLVRRDDDSPAALDVPASGMRRAIAVLGFKNLSGRDDARWIGTALTETMTSELAMGEQLRTIAVDDVERMKRELALGETDTLDRATLERVGRRLGTELVVTGGYLAVGGKIRLDVRLLDVASGEPIVAVSESDQESEFIDLVARTGASVRRSLRAGELSAEQASGVRASQPATPEGTRAYAEGLALLRSFDAAGARAAFEKVVALEPRFAPGHAALADALTLLGMLEAAAASAKKAMELSDALSRAERMLIEVRYHEATLAWDRAIEVAQTLHELFPDNLDYGLRLTKVQSEGGQPRDALATIAALRRLPPPLGDDPRIDLAEAQAHSDLGDGAAAQRAARIAITRAEAVGATSIALWAEVHLAWMHLEDGESERGIAVLEAIKQRAVEIGDHRLVLEVLNGLAAAYFYRDDLAAALRQDDELLELVRTLGNPSLAADHRTSRASVLLRLGRLDDAAADVADPAATSTPLLQAGARIVQAQVAIARGDPAKARAALTTAVSTLRAIDAGRELAWALAVLGELALLEDQLVEAAAAAQESLTLRERFNLRLFAGESRLLLARIARARGAHDEAATFAADAAQAFTSESARSVEAEARAELALARLAAGRLADAAEPIARARALGGDSQNVFARQRVAIAGARVDAAQRDFDAARQALAAAIAASTRYGLVPLTLEARLAAAQLERAAGHASEARAALAAVAADAEARGLHRIARAARAAQP